MRKEIINNMTVQWFNESASADDRNVPLLWLHGWGQSGTCFMSLATACTRSVSAVIDFPGFGESPMPDTSWGTEEYARAVEALIRKGFHEKVCLIGHSFGARIAVQIASKHPELIAGVVLVSGAGLPPHRSLWKRIRIRVIKSMLRVSGVFDQFFGSKMRKRVSAYFGSADYNAAGALRPILVNVVNEDLSEIAASIDVPTLLLYGEKDEETPPEMGERYRELIQNSELVVLPKFAHLSILSDGRHQLANLIGQFVRKVSMSR